MKRPLYKPTPETLHLKSHKFPLVTSLSADLLVIVANMR